MEKERETEEPGLSAIPNKTIHMSEVILDPP